MADTGAQAVYTALGTALTPTSIFGVLVIAVPLIGVMTLVALTIHIVRKQVKGASKAKVSF